MTIEDDMRYEKSVARSRADGTDYEGPVRMRAVFNPVNIETLKPFMVPLIGKTIEVFFDGFVDESYTYAGQKRWQISAANNLDRGTYLWRWLPDEDLQFVADLDAEPVT